MTTVDVPIFKNRPDLSTPVDAAHLTAWGDAIKANADAAEAAEAGVAAQLLEWAVDTSDAAVAALAADPASLTRGAGNAVWQRRATIDVCDYGAVGDGSADSSAGIQAAIDAAAAQVIASGMAATGTVVIAGGRYRLNTQVIQPPYVKVVALGTVIFDTYVVGDVAWRITPLSTDPSNLSGGTLGKQQWTWGTILEGSGGAFIFSNRTGTRAGTTALELGSRTDLGVTRPLCRYRLADVAIQEYGVAIQWNSINHYIGTYERFHIENCDNGVHYGSGGAVVNNAGEKITWVDSLFATMPAGSAAHQVDCDTVNLTFVYCSFDYLSAILRYDVVAGYQRADFFGGHVENINTNTRYHVDGGWVVSKATATIRPEVAIYGAAFAAFDRMTTFKGQFALKADFDYRAVGAELPYANGYLCESAVEVRGWNVRQWEAWANPAKSLGVIPDPTFTLQTTGADVGAITGWTVSTGSGVTGTVTADGPVSGDKSLSLVLAASSYRRFTPTPKVPIKPGQQLRMTAAVNRSATISVQVGATFYTENGTILATASPAALNFGTTLGAWVFPVKPRTTGLMAPPGCAYVVPFWDITSVAGTAGVAQKISDLYAWVE